MEAASSLQAAPSCLLGERRGENSGEDGEGSSRLMLEKRAVVCELRDQMANSTCVCVCVCAEKRLTFVVPRCSHRDQCIYLLEAE